MKVFEKRMSVNAKDASIFCNLIKSLDQFVVIEATIGGAFNFLEPKEQLS
jgi:hypothetical protein